MAQIFVLQVLKNYKETRYGHRTRHYEDLLLTKMKLIY